MSKVAFIGLGVMGYPMAGHIRAKGGHEVTVYNRTLGKAQAWIAEFGGHMAPTPEQTAREADFVFACVGNDDDLRSVATGPHGAFHGLKKGAIFLHPNGRGTKNKEKITALFGSETKLKSAEALTFGTGNCHLL